MVSDAVADGKVFDNGGGSGQGENKQGQFMDTGGSSSVIAPDSLLNEYVPDSFEDTGGSSYVIAPDSLGDGMAQYVPDSFEDAMPDSPPQEDIDDETISEVIMPMYDIYLPRYREIYERNKRAKLSHDE